LMQIEKGIKERMPDAPKELAGSITENLKQIDGLIGKLASPTQEGLGYRGASQLSEKLFSLFSTIQGVNAAPTAAQKEYFDELQQEYQAKLPEVGKYLTDQLAKLNDFLRKNNAPTVIAGKGVEMPR
jgi:hypothetical protein